MSPCRQKMWQNLFWKQWRQFRHQLFTPLCHSLKNYRYMHLSIFRIKYRVPLILKTASHSFVIPAKLVLDQIGERERQKKWNENLLRMVCDWYDNFLPVQQLLIFTNILQGFPTLFGKNWLAHKIRLLINYNFEFLHSGRHIRMC